MNVVKQQPSKHSRQDGTFKPPKNCAGFHGPCPSWHLLELLMHQTDGVGLAPVGVDGPGHGGSARLF